MSRFRGIKGRLGRAEATNDGSSTVPSVLRVAFGQPQAEARARFDAEYPTRKPGHNLLIVPAKPRTDAERTIWAERFHAQQMALVAAARSGRISATVAAPTPQSTFPPGIPVPPKGRAFVKWKALLP